MSFYYSSFRNPPVSSCAQFQTCEMKREKFSTSDPVNLELSFFKNSVLAKRDVLYVFLIS